MFVPTTVTHCLCHPLLMAERSAHLLTLCPTPTTSRKAVFLSWVHATDVVTVSMARGSPSLTIPRPAPAHPPAHWQAGRHTHGRQGRAVSAGGDVLHGRRGPAAAACGDASHRRLGRASTAGGDAPPQLVVLLSVDTGNVEGNLWDRCFVPFPH